MAATAPLEAVSWLEAWEVPGEDVARARRAAREQARLECELAGCDREETRRAADAAARRAARAAPGHDPGARWCAPVEDLELTDAHIETLEVIARLSLTTPTLLAQLLPEPVAKSTVHERFKHLHEAGLIARATVGVQGRSGRPPLVYAIAPRGSEALRERMCGGAPPQFLAVGRRLPEPGRGENVPREVTAQLALVALRQYDVGLRWRTARMPDGCWDLGTVEGRRPDCGLRVADLAPAAGCPMFGADLDAPTSVAPDLSVRLRGPVDDGHQAAIDLLVEVDPGGSSPANARKFVAYDHFLGGWCMGTRRFGETGRPLVVFVARRSRDVRALLATADECMSLGFGAPGCDERDTFDYPGREHTAFTCIDWLMAGAGFAVRLDPRPPGVRGWEMPLFSWPERVALFPEEWCPAPRAVRGSASAGASRKAPTGQTDRTEAASQPVGR